MNYVALIKNMERELLIAKGTSTALREELELTKKRLEKAKRLIDMLQKLREEQNGNTSACPRLFGVCNGPCLPPYAYPFPESLSEEGKQWFHHFEAIFTGAHTVPVESTEAVREITAKSIEERQMAIAEQRLQLDVDLAENSVAIAARNMAIAERNTLMAETRLQMDLEQAARKQGCGIRANCRLPVYGSSQAWNTLMAETRLQMDLEQAARKQGCGIHHTTGNPD